MYLGWPKSASSWLYRQLTKADATPIANVKENHLWYTNPELAIEKYHSCSGDLIVDFSTNNWSMDSNTANTVYDLFDYFILVHRDPNDIVSSYYLMNHGDHYEDQWQNWQNTCLYNNLCNTGDILERWHSLIGNKLKVYEYHDLCNNHQLFLDNLCKDIGIKPIASDIEKDNQSPKPHLEITNSNLRTLISVQENKFYKLLGNIS